jgi:hypothetical protein
VLAFHFPQYLTTPELRHKYSVDVLRQILLVGAAGGRRHVAGQSDAQPPAQPQHRGVSAGVCAVALGGSRVPVGNFPDHTPYIGLDWFILDLLGSTLIFVVIEKLFPLYKGQAIFRRNGRPT